MQNPCSLIFLVVKLGRQLGLVGGEEEKERVNETLEFVGELFKTEGPHLCRTDQVASFLETWDFLLCCSTSLQSPSDKRSRVRSKTEATQLCCCLKSKSQQQQTGLGWLHHESTVGAFFKTKQNKTNAKVTKTSLKGSMLGHLEYLKMKMFIRV